VEIPKINSREALIKVMAAGVCVTDLHVYSGKFRYGKPPHILGHEFSGEITEVGEAVTGWRAGDRVAAETSVGCGECAFCKTGNRHLCNKMEEIGTSPHNGAYAQYIKVPAENLFRLPPNVGFEESAILESAVCPVGALMRLGVRFGETVCVIGVGPAGISFIQGARAMGAGKIIAVGRHDARLARAVRFGADAAINSLTEDFAERMLEETGGAGADLVCEAAGGSQTIAAAFAA